MKITNHVVLWFSIVAIGRAPLAYATPHTEKDLKFDEKEYKIKELKIHDHGWKAEYSTKADFSAAKRQCAGRAGTWPTKERLR